MLQFILRSSPKEIHVLLDLDTSEVAVITHCFLNKNNHLLTRLIFFFLSIFKKKDSYDEIFVF